VGSFPSFIITTYLENFRDVTRVDIVAGDGTGVACKDGEIIAGYAQSRAAIVGIPGDIDISSASKGLGSCETIRVKCMLSVPSFG